MLAQILWIAGLQHHALNSFRILDFDLVYPSHPGKILSPLPSAKGTLTDDMVAQDYISGAALMATSAEAQVAYTHPDTIYVADMSALSIGPPIQFFVGPQGFAFAFYPLLQTPNRLTNIYLSDMEDKRSAQVALKLRQDLREIGARILKRDEYWFSQVWAAGSGAAAFQSLYLTKWKGWGVRERRRDYMELKAGGGGRREEVKSYNWSRGLNGKGGEILCLLCVCVCVSFL